MKNLSPQFWFDVEAVLDKKLAKLQSIAFEELAKMPETASDSCITINEKKVSFTIFVYQHNLSSIIVVVQAAVQMWLGIYWRSFEKGFVTLEDGSKRPTTQKELESVL